jgi:hypothetical protein
MAVLLRFAPEKMNAASYYDVLKRLDEAGAGSPEGRLYHVCFGDGDCLRVSDIWDTVESFQKFGEILMPIMQDLGIDPGEPEVIEVHNIIRA